MKPAVSEAESTSDSVMEEHVRRHLRRHGILLVMICGFVGCLLGMVFDFGGICSRKRQDGNVPNNWEFAFISEKIAQCKDDLDDLSGSAWLPWLSVVFFPFVMIQFDVTLETIRNELQSIQPEDIHEQKPLKHSHPSRTRESVERVNTYNHNEDWLMYVVRVLEAMCVGGYFWLVNYDHTGPNRRRHGVATGILFMSATVLNLILWWQYGTYKKRVHGKDHDVGMSPHIVLFAVMLQLGSVVAFAVAIFRSWSVDQSKNQDVAVALEYVVAVIWFITIILDGILYLFIRDPDHSAPLPKWLWRSTVLYCSLALMGTLGLHLLVLTFVRPIQ